MIDRRARVALVCLTSIAIGLLVAAQTAQAQQAREPEEPRRYAWIKTGAAIGEGDVAPAISAALGSWLDRRVGIEVELAYARQPGLEGDRCATGAGCALGERDSLTGRTVSILPHAVFAISPRASRLHAYLAAGGGVTHVRQWLVVGRGVGEVEFKRSAVVPTLSVGGGLDARLASRASLGADIRLVHLFDERDDEERFRNLPDTGTTLRVGVRLGYRF